MPIKRVAVIGAGPSGAITVDALAQEKEFDQIKVFERREASGGCWIGSDTPSRLSNFDALASRTADPPIAIPETLPAKTPRCTTNRFDDSSIYPYLETNVDDLAMTFSQEPIPSDRSDASVALHGPDTPFRHWTLMRGYVRSLFERNDYDDLVSYRTSVERCVKDGEEWELTLRRPADDKADGSGVSALDEWWTERFDAVVVAGGHFSVPYVPAIEGLEAFETMQPGSVLHSKNYRGRETLRGKRVVVVGASVSAADIAFDLTATAARPVHAVVNGRNTSIYFGDEAFNHPCIERHVSIARVAPEDDRTVHFIDGTSVSGVDVILFGTGYSWSLPYLPQVEIRQNRVANLYQHVVYRPDPSLCFIGAVGAGLTFKIFEWQAVLAARVFAGRAALPPVEEQRRWEEERVARVGEGSKFSLVYPDFEAYFEEIRRMAGPGQEGKGRQLPPFDPRWFEAFMSGHERRKAMWARINKEAREKEGAERERKVGVDEEVIAERTPGVAEGLPEVEVKAS